MKIIHHHLSISLFSAFARATRRQPRSGIDGSGQTRQSVIGKQPQSMNAASLPRVDHAARALAAGGGAWRVGEYADGVKPTALQGCGLVALCALLGAIVGGAAGIIYPMIVNPTGNIVPAQFVFLMVGTPVGALIGALVGMYRLSRRKGER
jgi:hypothetical protein